MPDPVIVETGPSPDAAIVLLHGLGADGHDFEPIVPELRLPSTARWRFVFPHAPVRPVTINGGVAMPAWFDILGLDRQSATDEAGIRASAAALGDWVGEQVGAGIAPERIVVAGFSQGGAVALTHALLSDTRYAGVLALSTYLPMPDVLATARPDGAAPLDVLMVHGSLDPVLPIGLAEASRDELIKWGHQVQWQAYPMPHSVCAEEIMLTRDWLLARLPG